MRSLHRTSLLGLSGLLIVIVGGVLVILHAMAYSSYRMLFASELPGWAGYAWYLMLFWVGPLGLAGIMGAIARLLVERLNATAVGTYVIILITGIFVSHIMGILGRESAAALAGHAPRLLRMVETGWDAGTTLGVLSGVLTAAKRIWSRAPEGTR